ncbi:hypothetical protein L6452_30446 [Arctium lappa]|uniref:Uncharacterized protein n=2 Tax=Arctium lappa TaxID=4217 RepID=A0ACB8ZIM4_ARCLA|nr:hypothetical protein L6452_30444 [Arctium lappa]KAI3697434.1 hypothetical protein L6452_30446 [Arctium lappa]
MGKNFFLLSVKVEKKHERPHIAMRIEELHRPRTEVQKRELLESFGSRVWFVDLLIHLQSVGYAQILDVSNYDLVQVRWCGVRTCYKTSLISDTTNGGGQGGRAPLRGPRGRVPGSGPLPISGQSLWWLSTEALVAHDRGSGGFCRGSGRRLSGRLRTRGSSAYLWIGSV